MSFSMRLLLALLIMVVLEIYFVKRVSGSAKILFPSATKKKIKYLIIAVLVLVNMYPLAGIGIRMFASRDFTAPQGVLIDYLLIFPFWVLALTIVQSLFFLLPFDFFKLLLYPFYRKHKEKLKRLEAKFVIILVAAFCIYVPFRVVYDMNAVSVRLVEYQKENLPPELEGFKITLIADIQADRYTDDNRLQHFIDKVNTTDADLVLIAGDVITGSPFYIKTAAEYLSKIKSKYGVYSCVGDHDNWAYRSDNDRSLREITEALKEYDIQMINNQNRTIDIGNSQIGISFITYTYSRKISDGILDNLTNEFNSGKLKIFLTHQPNQKLIDTAIKKNYDLMFAGHTHGGQITMFFPFINPSITHIETRYVKGDFRFDDMLMVVTRGLGMSIAPVRYNSTPEVTVIKLTGKKD
jgi:predicted MPP superfamily phosphohydrolase